MCGGGGEKYQYVGKERSFISQGPATVKFKQSIISSVEGFQLISDTKYKLIVYAK